MPTISVNFDARELQQLLQQIGQRLRDLQPVLLSAADRLLQRARQAFQQERSPEGLPWPALSRTYGERKQRLFGGRKKLFATGALFGSLRSGVEGKVAFVSTGNLPYARIHQFGGRGRKAQIPPRPYLPAAETAENEVLQVVNHALEEATREQ